MIIQHDVYTLRLKRYIQTVLRKAIKNNNPYKKYIKQLIKLDIVLKMNSRLAETWAYCTYEENKRKFNGFEVNFNLELFYGISSTKFRREIITHELAHCIDVLIRGDSFHDTEWRNIHISLGGTGGTFADRKDFS